MAEVCSRQRLASIVLCAYVVASAPALAGPRVEKIVHYFRGETDGAIPYANLTVDKAGNLFGTTVDGGGAGGNCAAGGGCGTVFKIAPGGTESVLYTFTGGADGSSPDGTVVEDKTGDLFGIANYGGANNLGVAVKLAPDWPESTLYNFCSLKNCADGEVPSGAVVMDKSGNLYGTTAGGGVEENIHCAGRGCGVVFKVAPDGTETVLYAFTDNNGDGAFPSSGVIMDKSGNLLGTAGWSGANNCLDCGIVFEIAPSGKEKILYSFSNANGGAFNPIGGLIEDKNGDLYGTTRYGGTSNDGTVFKLSPDGTLTVLHSFAGSPNDGNGPVGSLMADSQGNLYGTTEYGGNSHNCASCGIVFEILADGTENVLYNFCSQTNCKDGAIPTAGFVVRKKNGPLISTTTGGGNRECTVNENPADCGTVFEIVR